VLFGDLLDDHIYGEGGDDLLIGGHGADYMDGGPGNDWFRGDTNTDEFHGDDGTDVVSLMSAMPPGQPDQSQFDGSALAGPHHFVPGDGYQEPMASIGVLIGSPYDDHFVAPGHLRMVGSYGRDVFETRAGDTAAPGDGGDECNGQACAGSNADPPR